MIDPALGVVLDEGARALDPVKLVTLLRDGSDACQPLTWLPPSGPDQIGAQLALRTFIAAACDLKTPAAPLAAAIAATDPLPAVAKAAGVDEARAEQAIRAGLAGRRRHGARTRCCRRPAPTRSGRCPAWCPPTGCCSAVQGADDACAPLTWQPTNGVQEMAAELVLYGVIGAACETGLSVLAVADALDRRRAARGARGAAPPRACWPVWTPARRRARSARSVRSRCRQTIGNVPIYDAIGIIRDRAVDDPHRAAGRAPGRRRASAPR